MRATNWAIAVPMSLLKSMKMRRMIEMTPQDRWQKEHAYIAKSFKMFRGDADRFKAACDKVGVSQSQQIAKMIGEFCESVEKTEGKQKSQA